MTQYAYPRIGKTDTEDPYVILLPDADTNSYSAPNSVATITAITDGNAGTSLSGAGYVQIKMDGTKYKLLLLAAESTAN